MPLRFLAFRSPLRPFASFAFHALLAFGLPFGNALADSYPSKPIRIIVPYPPGGFNDTLARKLGQKLNEKWGQPVVVDNRPGGSTTIGTNLAAKAPADGHTLLIVSFAFGVNPSLYAQLPYDTQRDFAPVVLAAGTPNILVVNPQLPVKSVQELIALAKSKPGKLNYATAGNGSSNHLSMEMFKSMAGVDIVHVPYKGSAPAVTDLIGGQVDVMFDNVPNVLQHVKAGKLRGLAVSSSKRSPFTSIMTESSFISTQRTRRRPFADGTSCSSPLPNVRPLIMAKCFSRGPEIPMRVILGGAAGALAVGLVSRPENPCVEFGKNGSLPSLGL